MALPPFNSISAAGATLAAQNAAAQKAAEQARRFGLSPTRLGLVEEVDVPEEMVVITGEGQPFPSTPPPPVFQSAPANPVFSPLAAARARAAARALSAAAPSAIAPVADDPSEVQAADNARMSFAQVAREAPREAGNAIRNAYRSLMDTPFDEIVASHVKGVLKDTSPITGRPSRNVRRLGRLFGKNLEAAGEGLGKGIGALYKLVPEDSDLHDLVGGFVEQAPVPAAPAASPVPAGRSTLPVALAAVQAAPAAVPADTQIAASSAPVSAAQAGEPEQAVVAEQMGGSFDIPEEYQGYFRVSSGPGIPLDALGPDPTYYIPGTYAFDAPSHILPDSDSNPDYPVRLGTRPNGEVRPGDWYYETLPNGKEVKRVVLPGEVPWVSQSVASSRLASASGNGSFNDDRNPNYPVRLGTRPNGEVRPGDWYYETLPSNKQVKRVVLPGEIPRIRQTAAASPSAAAVSKDPVEIRKGLNDKYGELMNERTEDPLTSSSYIRPGSSPTARAARALHSNFLTLAREAEDIAGGAESFRANPFYWTQQLYSRLPDDIEASLFHVQGLPAPMRASDYMAQARKAAGGQLPPEVVSQIMDATTGEGEDRVVWVEADGSLARKPPTRLEQASALSELQQILLGNVGFGGY